MELQIGTYYTNLLLLDTPQQHVQSKESSIVLPKQEWIISAVKENLEEVMW